MNDFLRSISVIRDFTITLNCSKSYFLKMLHESTDPSRLELFEALKSGKPFKGTIEGDSFTIRQRMTGATSNRRMLVKIKGVARQHDNKTIVDVETNGFHSFLWIPIGLFGGFILLAVGLSITNQAALPGFVLSALGVQFSFLLLILYYLMRRASSNAQREIEKEFYFITKDYNG